MEGWIGMELRVESGGVTLSIWRFLKMLMKIQTPLDAIALLGVFLLDWTFDVAFLVEHLNTQAHVVDEWWRGRDCLSWTCREVLGCHFLF